MCYALEQSCAIGRAEGRIKDIERIMQKLNMSQDEAMDFLDISVAERENILAVLKATQERK